MENTLYVALSQQHALRRRMEVVANNLANMNTNGFKAHRMLFNDYMAEANRIGPREQGDQLRLVVDRAVARDVRQGPLEYTNTEFDVAINGPGYFVVDTAMGPRYTRDGALQLDADRQLVDRNGLVLQNRDGGGIRVPDDAQEVTISGDGTVTVRLTADNAAPPIAIGQIRVVQFENEFELDTLGNGLLVSNERPETIEFPNLVQGMLEGSNVQGVLEMTEMIEVSRAYSRASKVVTDEHERIRRAIQGLGSTRA